MLDVWVEAREIEGAAPRLRGEIEDLDTHRRAGLKSFGDIEHFIRCWIDADRRDGLEPEWEKP